MKTVKKGITYDITGASKTHCEACKYRGVQVCKASGKNLSNYKKVINERIEVVSYRLAWCIEGEIDEDI